MFTKRQVWADYVTTSILVYHCTRKELESLIGYLQHACKVIPQGRTFLRRMINLLSAFRREDHPIRLNREFHLDLSWWLEFFKSWNGKSFFLSPEWAPLLDFQMSSAWSLCLSGSLVLGQNLNWASPLHTGLWCHRVEWSSCRTINRSWMYCNQAQRKTPTWLCYFGISSWWQLDIHSHLQQLTSKISRIPLLKPFLNFNFSIFASWPHMQIRWQRQFLSQWSRN